MHPAMHWETLELWRTAAQDPISDPNTDHHLQMELQIFHQAATHPSLSEKPSSSTRIPRHHEPAWQLTQSQRAPDDHIHHLVDDV